jgi:hypothetical protein
MRFRRPFAQPASPQMQRQFIAMQPQFQTLQRIHGK